MSTKYRYSKRYSGPHMAWLIIVVDDEDRECSTISMEQRIPRHVDEAIQSARLVDVDLRGPRYGVAPLVFYRESDVDLILDQLNKEI